MPTTSQIKTIHLGRKICGLDRERYVLLLANVAGVETSKDLDNRGVENVLAVMESMGFNSHPGGPTYWQDKAANQGRVCGERMARKITELHALPGAVRYNLSALASTFSRGRTGRVEELRPQEGWKLIEMLKACAAREAARPAPQAGAYLGDASMTHLLTD